MRLIGLLLSIGLFVCAAEGIVGTGLKSWFRNPTFNCDGNRELDYNWRCDGHLDCNDKTDERNCEYEDCIPDDPYRFSCKDSNRCILDQFVCDGINDCADGSDEINCSLGISCSAEFFVCADNSTCYPKSFMCDGHPDCPDKSDESLENCHGTLHGYAKCLGKFACGYGICLEDEKFVCDGNKNCPDGKDELPATCQSHPDCKNCTQHCTRHSHGVTCGCDAGYELAEDSGTCNDVDECARGICSQNCRNSKGSFTCSCKNGFKLVNGTKCENKVKATYVWYSGDAFKGREVILERDGRERKFRISSMHERVSSAIMPHMQFDIDNDKLYTQTGDTLYSMSTNTRRLSRPKLEKVLSQTNQTLDFAVDPATGNIYFSTYKGFAINVCETNGLCVSYAPRRPYYVSNLRIVRLSNQTRVFWKEGTQVMSGSLDGQEIRTVFKVMNGHPILYFVVDEQSEKMYLVESHLLEVDVATGKARRLTKLNFKNSSILWNMAVDDDKILVQSVQMKSFHEYIGHRIFNQILMIDRQTGDHLGLLEIPSRQQLHSVMRKSSRPVHNPCSDDKCSHVCVPSSGVVAYKCLCPPGMHLDEGDDSTCVPQEGEEQVYFVNGTHVSVYVYEGDELYLNQDFDLNVAPVAIATSLDMNLLYASQHKIYELMRDGSTKQYQVPGVRTMVVDPVDNVLYAANEYELLAVNLKTSEVALIRSGDYIKHMDIDPLNRVLYAETTGSEMYSFEIGAWDRVELDSLAQTSDHEERNWSFNPLLRTIQPDVALVLDGGVCEIADYLPRGFECHRQLPSRGHQNHSNHLPRLLARAGPPVVALKGAACDTMKCNFCVSANGSQGKKALEPVCVCPYGHELGADGVSCNKACAPQMLRCKDEKQCVHQSRRCDGYKDCQDGSDELNCAEHDCGENFKCHLSGICIAARNRCDGVFDCADHSDEDHCQKRDCPTSQFKCEDGFCLPETKRCDGIRDCFHGDDELNCPKVACKKNEFDCGNSKCISQDWLCDSQNDCPNGEDEANCPALVEKVRKLPKHDCNSKWIFCCKSGEQLPLNMKCNGIDECSDGSDEEHCNITCKAPQFQCNDGACLQESEVCDGIPHCPNAADEHNCKNKCSEKGLFECGADGICIPQAKICDGKKDCSDGADEVASRCPVTPKTPANSSCSANEYRCHDGKCIHLFEVCDGKKQCADGSDENEFCGKLDCKASKCSHDCYSNGPREVKCKCPKGYDLLDNGRTCDDIDECRKTPEVCSQFCKNLKGSFECFCAPGFRKNANGDCRVESGDAIMMIVENGRVETIDKNKNRDMLLNLPAAHIESFDYDVSKGLVYVSDTDNGKIHRIPLNANNGKYKHELYDQLKPGALAFDWVARNLYFADHRPSIHVCHGVMAKGFCKILTEVNIKPVADAPEPAITSIALVPDEGIMFYSEASTGFIYRQNMDGTDKSPFPWAAGDRRPLSLTVDHVQRTLYWIDAHGGSIESSNFEGGRIRRVVDNVAYVKTFTLFEDYLYYPEPDTENWVVVHKQSRKIRSSKHSPLGRASQVKIMHQVNQPAEVNRCFRSGCQQICLLKPHGFACACTDGQELSNDNRTCVKAAIDDTNLFDETWQEKLKKECSCENGGKCTLWKEMRGKYHCECPPGYHGDRCESGPTSSLVLTVFLICTFFIVFAGAGVYLMTLACSRSVFVSLRSLDTSVSDLHELSGTDERHLVSARLQRQEGTPQEGSTCLGCR